MSADPSKSKPRRRWLQFSLRTMMVVVTVFCIILGIIAKRARDQRQAVEAILEAGGRVYYDHEIDDSDPPGPEWLRRLVGDEYFFSVAQGNLLGPEINDESLVAFERFTDLKWLNLMNTQITGAGLVHLKGLTNLIMLDLRGSQVTDAGLVYLRDLTNLEYLSFDNTHVTDEGVKNLQQALPNCMIVN